MSNESLRILRVTNSIYPEVMGGVGLHTHHMSRLQAEMGHDVTVLTSDNGDRSLPRREQRDGYEIIRHREMARPLDNSVIPGIFRSFRQLRSEHDVIHLHSHLYFSSNIGALLSLSASSPVVVTNHGLISQTAPGWVQRIFNPTIGKFTFETADSILCYTETDMERLRNRGIGSHIDVIHNGIDCDRFSPSDGSSSRTILFVGRLKRGKGVDDLVEAFGSLAGGYPEWELNIVGDGPLRDKLERAADTYDVASRVTFFGEVPNERMPEIYNEAEIFCLPSLSEGLPRTVMEAMACETPVLTSDLPQLESLVDGAGYTVPPECPSELASTLEDLLDNSETRREFGRTGREKIVEHHSWTDTVRQTTDLYTELIDRSTG